jgi:hypothetical protein
LLQKRLERGRLLRGQRVQQPGLGEPRKQRAHGGGPLLLSSAIFFANLSWNL